MITLHFEKLYCNPHMEEPCFISIPLPKGTLYHTDEVSFLQNDHLLPSQSKVTGRYEDNSIRYLFSRFLADLPANSKAEVTCCLTKQELPIAPSTSLSCTESAAGFEVSTGPLHVVVAHDSASLFQSLDYEDRHYDGSAFIGPLLQTQSLAYRMHYNKWHIVEKGDVCIILSCDGFLEPEQMIPDQPQNAALPCQIRLTLYAGKSWIDTSVRLTNATPDALALHQYHFAVSFPAQDTPRTCAAASNYKTSFAASNDGACMRKDATAKLLLHQGNEHFAEVLYGTLFADITDSHCGVCGTFYQAFQNYPKAVQADADSLVLYLVPPDAEPVIMQSGMAREQRFQLFFHNAQTSLEEINDRSLLYQMPDRPTLEPSVYQKAGVMPDIFVSSANRNAQVELALIQCADSHARSYGMMNWGDSPDPGYTAQGKGHGNLVWTNNEYDFPHACMLLYAMTGQRRFLDYCIVAANHQIDVDVCHYSEDPLLLGGQWTHSNGHILDSAIVCSHEWVEGLLDCYHAIGDERYLETALGIGENVLRLLETPMYQENGGLSARETGWALRTLTALYTETRDTKWVEKADWIVAQFDQWAKRYGGWLAPYTDNVVIRVPFMISIAVGSLMRYYREFPQESIRTMILSAVDDMIEHCLLEQGLFYYKELPSLSRIGNNPLPLEALAIAYELTGDRKYIDAGQKTFEQTVLSMSGAGGSGKQQIGDAVISGKEGSKRFAQSFLPVASFYKALSELP